MRLSNRILRNKSRRFDQLIKKKKKKIKKRLIRKDLILSYLILSDFIDLRGGLQLQPQPSTSHHHG